AVAPHEWDGVPAPDPERAIARLRAGTAPQPPPNAGRSKQPADIAWRSRTYVALAVAFAAGVLAGGGALTAPYGDEKRRGPVTPARDVPERGVRRTGRI
ncbi:hypothetical protein, partial [Streptomyces sp. NPDC127197]